MSTTSSSRLRVALWGPIMASVLGMWTLGGACYHDLYLTSIDLQSDRMAKWDISAMLEDYRSDKWEHLSMLALVVPAALCFVGPLVGALLSRADVRRAMLAGMTGAFFAILGFPAPLGVAMASGDPIASVGGVLFVIVSALPLAAVFGGAGGLAGAAICGRSSEPELPRSFAPFRHQGETALYGLMREAAILRATLDASTRRLSDGDLTLAFAWVQSAQALSESDIQTLADLGIDATQLLPWLDRRTPRARQRIVQWLMRFEATVERSDGRSAYR